ncbi:helix-turn-helix transcriptional regulator [Actinoplanes sp. NPDC023936]|uniref:helix-turn-helix transcriptional regulator n=1 Tax=Actinoplanes sp. NPDC023936 TaxID=3154910 RepID=UPI0033FE132E
MTDAIQKGERGKVSATPRVDVNRSLFLYALRANGAITGEDQARILGTSRRNVDHYLAGTVEPKLTTARRIAAALGCQVDDLWPTDTKAAA